MTVKIRLRNNCPEVVDLVDTAVNAIVRRYYEILRPMNILEKVAKTTSEELQEMEDARFLERMKSL